VFSFNIEFKYTTFYGYYQTDSNIQCGNVFFELKGNGFEVELDSNYDSLK
jgi:hypothetical protein